MPANGQANLATGAYQLSGSYFNLPIAITGQLPATPDASGTLSLTFNNGSPYNGSLNAGMPPPTATPTPGCQTADLQVDLSAASGNFNGNTASFVVRDMLAAIEQKAPDYFPGFHEAFNSTFIGTDCGTGSQLRNIHVEIFEVVGGLAGGQSFPISLGGGEGAGALVSYGEEGAGGDRVWTATAGTLFVDAVNGSAVTLRITAATMTASGGSATGGFTLDLSGQLSNFRRQQD